MNDLDVLLEKIRKEIKNLRGFIKAAGLQEEYESYVSRQPARLEEIPAMEGRQINLKEQEEMREKEMKGREETPEKSGKTQVSL